MLVNADPCPCGAAAARFDLIINGTLFPRAMRLHDDGPAVGVGVYFAPDHLQQWIESDPALHLATHRAVLLILEGAIAA